MLKYLVTALVALSPVAVTAASAQTGADLNISPRRLALRDKDRAATVYIFNQGDTPATYTIELADRVMRPDGQITPLDPAKGDTAASSAADYIQYTPRRVTLLPKTSQVIRVRVSPPGKGQAGEYRSHLVVTALPPETAGFTAEQAAKAGSSDVTMQVVAQFSISIPVIIREGAVDARASIDSAKRLPAQDGAPNGGVQLDLVRKGPNSVYGDVEVYAGRGAAEHLVGMVRGVAVYPEISRRTVTAPLSIPVAANEPLRVVYKDDDLQHGVSLATVSLPAP